MEYTIADIRFSDLAVTAETTYWPNPGPYSLQVEAVYIAPLANVAAAADVTVTLNKGVGGTEIAQYDAAADALTAGIPEAQTVNQVGDDLIVAPGEVLELVKAGAAAFSGGVSVRLRAVRI